MNILIVGDFRFPFGDAGSSRMRHFAMGLAEKGANVRVISSCNNHYRPEDIDENGKLSYKGIPYEVVGINRYLYQEKRSILEKILSQVRYYKNAQIAISRAKALIDSGQIDVVLQYGYCYSSLATMSIFCKTRKVVLIRDAVEWPGMFFLPFGPLHPRYLDYQLGIRKGMINSDGVICISHFLEEYYGGHGVSTVRIPAVIEIKNDISFDKIKSNRFNVTYLGTLIRRNGPFEMVVAVRKLLKKNIPVRFTVVGSAGTTGYGYRVRKFCDEDSILRDNIEFLGRVTDEEVIRRLRLADTLLFARPDDTEARAAFPTRLPEYLMSGRPVITAGVGDIPLYLRNEVDAIIVNPCNSETIAAAIEKLYRMPDQGKAIALSGFNRAKQFFDYKIRATEIYEFFQWMYEKKVRGIKPFVTWSTE